RRVDAVLLDEAGHLIVPHVLPDRVYDVTFAGEQVSASFVKSDVLSAMTILKLSRVPADAEVMRVARQRPRLAELSVVLPPDGGAGRLVVWHGAPREKALADGLVIVVADAEGEQTRAAIAGFVCNNEFRPLDLAQVVATQIAAGQPVQRARLGLLVGVVTPSGAAADRVPGQVFPDAQNIKPRTSLVVLRVLPESAAEAAGVRQGDQVLAFNGRPVSNLAEFASILADTREQATLSVLRDGVPMDLDIALADETPAEEPEPES
ncbi:MAG: PDZ domain-containing protein, partial [Planctomycetota bacterium]